MPKPYKHLTNHERDLLSVLKSKGQSVREIAEALKRSPATISRELKRNAPPVHTGYYLAHKAHERAVSRAITCRTHKRLKNDKIRKYVRRRIRHGWSPELIAGRLKKLHPELSIAMKPFTNGSMPMPENSFRHFFGLTVTASDEAIHGVTRRPIFRRECRSKNALNMFNRVRSQGTGRQTRLSHVKAGQPCKLALNERPGLPKLLNCLGKGLTP